MNNNYPRPRPSIQNLLIPPSIKTPHTPTLHNKYHTVIFKEEPIDYNNQYYKNAFHKHQPGIINDTSQYGMNKLMSPSYKGKQISIGSQPTLVISKKRDQGGNNSGTTTLVSSYEPIKPFLSQSDGVKKNMFESLDSTNSNRKSRDHNIMTTRSHEEYKIENGNDDPIYHQFEIIKQIGQGKFSKVSIARHIPTGSVFGLKTIKKSTIAHENLMTQLMRQIKILSFIEHPHIVSLYKVFSYGENIYLVEELGCDGQLYSKMVNNKFSEEGTSIIMRGLLSAVSYLHTQNIIHRDIKPENVVVVHGIVKLCDLGWSVHTKSKFRETFCGTPLYASPQLLQGTKYNQKIDLWALGVMAFELRFGYTPFNIKTKTQLHKIITDEIDFPEEQVSEDFQHFIKTLLQKNPKQRLTAEMMLKHPFILNYQEFQTCQELCNRKNK